MFDSDSVYLFLFGDNHHDPRDEVRERLYSVIPDSAEAMLIEHYEKSPHGSDLSRRVYWRNPSMYLFQFFGQMYSAYFRRKSNRIVTPREETVAEEVAKDLNLEIEYTDIPFRDRYDQQPMWLTFLSLTAVLLLFFGWRIGPWVTVVGLISVLGVVLVTQRVFYQMREVIMAEDCFDIASRYDVGVVFVGDSHVEPLVDRLQGRVGVVLAEGSRPS